MTITTVFDPPQPSDSREVFDQKAFDTVSKLNAWSSEANQTATDINDMVTSPGVIAIGSDLAGANTIGTVAAVAADVSAVAAIDSDVSAVAAIDADVSAVAANEANINAAVADLPALSAKVSKTGDTMTGHLSVPAGATGSQVPRSSEVVPLVGGVTMTGELTVPSLNSGHLAGHRNRIINGDMRIAQRGTSFAAAVGYTLDRWVYYSIGASVATVSRQADAPTGSGFVDSLRLTVTTGDNSIAAGDFATLSTIIEGKYVTDLIGKPFTLSFWVRSSRAGTYCVAFGNAGDDRSYVATYSITTANTWQKKTITISGGLITAGTWDWGNGAGVSVTFTLAGGSSFQTTPGDWRTGSYFSTSNQQNAINAASNIFAITGVQLEPGTVATPFERRLNELELCQRYARLNSVTTGWSTSTTAVVAPAYFDKPMRAVPSATLTNGVGALSEPGGSLRDITSIASASLTASGGFLEFTTPALTTEKPHLLLPDRVLFSAEF